MNTARDFSYSMTQSGELTEKHYRYPSGKDYRYIQEAGAAVFRDVFYIFGGKEDEQKIASLNGCRFEELSIRLQQR